MRMLSARSMVTGSWLLWLLGFGCSGGDSSQLEGAQTAKTCTPGTVYSCVRWNCNGHQQCMDDAGKLSPCMCDTSDSGVASGSAGLGGSGGLSAASSAMPGSKSSDAGVKQSAAKKAEDAG